MSEFVGQAAQIGLALTLILTSAHAQGDPATNATRAGGSGVAFLGGTGGVNAIEFTPGTGQCGGNSLQPIGWQFDVINPVTVSALTWYDDGLDGLDISHEVGIWMPDGTLIESTHVTIPGGTGAALDGHWRVQPIQATELQPGVGYIVGGLNGQFNECLTMNISQSVHPDLAFFDATYLAGSAFDRPTSLSSATEGFYGVGFQIGGSSAGAYCFGDGSGIVCPCANSGAADEGCANSTGMGAKLVAGGSTQVSADDLTFQAAQLTPGQPALLFAGLNQVNGGAGTLFGDGLRCAGGAVVRLGVANANGSGDGAWGPGLIAQGGWVAGDLRRFQVWYRDPVGGPCNGGFNLSHGLELTFGP